MTTMQDAIKQGLKTEVTCRYLEALIEMLKKLQSSNEASVTIRLAQVTLCSLMVREAADQEFTPDSDQLGRVATKMWGEAMEDLEDFVAATVAPGEFPELQKVEAGSSAKCDTQAGG